MSYYRKYLEKFGAMSWTLKHIEDSLIEDWPERIEVKRYSVYHDETTDPVYVTISAIVNDTENRWEDYMAMRMTLPLEEARKCKLYQMLTGEKPA